jgi:hypothetical protein
MRGSFILSVGGFFQVEAGIPRQASWFELIISRRGEARFSTW